jgi:hypothetical protein
VVRWTTSGPARALLGKSHRAGTHRWVRPVAGVAAAVTVVAVAAAGPAALASAASPSVTRPGLAQVAPAPRLPLHTVAVGRLAPSATISGALGLTPRNDAALTNFVSAVTNKHSAEFGHYLAKGQFRALFGPTTATVDAVSAALRRSGLDVGKVSSDGLLVYFHGSAAQVESAFHTGLESYRLANGSLGRGTTSAVRLPASIAGSVATVAGLDDLVHAQAVGPIRASAAAHKNFPAATVPARERTGTAPGPVACTNATADATSFGGLTDDQIAGAYGANALYHASDTGAGQTIAVYELEPFLTSDLRTFDTCYFGATKATSMIANVHTIAVDGGQPTGPGSGEAILDVEDVSAVAPGATIDVYTAPNNSFGGIDDYADIVNTDTTQVATSSWGLCEQDAQTAEPGIQQEENFLFQQAAAQGQSVFAAAGDTGDDSCNEYRLPQPPPGQNPLSVLDPASQPYVVAVGGTTITDATQPPAEQVWNDGAEWGAGGGGISESWAMPSWQQTATDTTANATAVTAAQSVENNYVTQYGLANNGSTAGDEATPTFCLGTVTPTPSACRELPDVSAQADEFTGAVTIYSTEFASPGTPDGWITIGGTSSATPLWAAMTALVNASSYCADDLVGSVPDVGFITPLLYGIAGNPAAYAASFNDITSGNNDIYGLDDGAVFPAGTNYDMASGLGSPQLSGPGGTDGLAYYLCSYGHTGLAAPTVSAVAPSSGTVAGGTTLSVTGTGFVNGETSVTVGNNSVPAADVTWNSATSLSVDTPPALAAAASPAPQDGAGPADVTVTVNSSATSALSSQLSPNSVFEYVDTSGASTLPSVTGVSPYGGLETSPGQVTIYGAGFVDGATVTFGGQPASGATVVNDHEITVTPPAYSGSTTCAGGLPAGETATNDICQVYVQVTTGGGSSAEGAILPPYEGATLVPGNGGVASAPAGTEEMPAPTEFDYAPAPTVTSVSTSNGPNFLAGEFGGTTITVKGTGFNPLTLDWFNIGSSADASSQDFALSYLSGTEVQILAPLDLTAEGNTTVGTTTLPFSVKTIAGLSAPQNVTYAGIPTVSSVSILGAPDTGGTPLTIDGSGFANQVQYVVFVDAFTGFSAGTNYTLTDVTNTSLSTQTVAQNPAIVDALVCTATSCSYNPPADELVIYPPGNPIVTGSSPSTGPAHGGTKVTITGQNLGCVTGVKFGTTPVSVASNAVALLDCGSSNKVIAYAPPGAPNSTVKITLTTVESVLTGFGSSATTTAAEFHYTRSSPSPPRNFAVHPGNKQIHATWSPPAEDGGDLVDGYLVKVSAKGHKTITEVLKASARQVTVTKLSNGVTYTVTVAARSKLGTGPAATATAKPKS